MILAVPVVSYWNSRLSGILPKQALTWDFFPLKMTACAPAYPGAVRQITDSAWDATVGEPTHVALVYIEFTAWAYPAKIKN